MILFQDSEVLVKIATYKKFLVVRDPLERLYSAYRNKISSTDAPAKKFRKKFAMEMINEIRGEDVENKGTITFEVM